MKKIAFYLAASVCFVFSAASARAEYVRKALRPNFFVPAGEINRAEKLPPFPGWEKVKAEYAREKAAKAARAAAAEAERRAAEAEARRLREENAAIYGDYVPEISEPANVQNIYPEKNDAPVDYDFEKIPAYQKIRSDYAADLQVLSESGMAPENADVNAVLQKMQSGETIWVDDTFGLPPTTGEENAPTKTEEENAPAKKETDNGSTVAR